jgi:hypothetical protein
MGRISDEELNNVLHTMKDVFSSLLDFLESEADTTDDASSCPNAQAHAQFGSTCMYVLRAVGVYASQAPDIERQRVVKLLPYFFGGGYLDKFSAKTIEQELGQPLVEHLVRCFTPYFVLSTEDSFGIDALLESQWLRMTCDCLVKRRDPNATQSPYISKDTNNLFEFAVKDALRQIKQNVVNVDATVGLSDEIKASIDRLMSSALRDAPKSQN